MYVFSIRHSMVLTRTVGVFTVESVRPALILTGPTGSAIRFRANDTVCVFPPGRTEVSADMLGFGFGFEVVL